NEKVEDINGSPRSQSQMVSLFKPSCHAKLICLSVHCCNEKLLMKIISEMFTASVVYLIFEYTVFQTARVEAGSIGDTQCLFIHY
ncbi:hypothetical protein GOODEAATRI_012464, partial [Goodea atripinnis]